MRCAALLKVPPTTPNQAKARPGRVMRQLRAVGRALGVRSSGQDEPGQVGRGGCRRVGGWHWGTRRHWVGMRPRWCAPRGVRVGGGQVQFPGVVTADLARRWWVAIVHRFPFAAAHCTDARSLPRCWARCDNPLFQRIGTRHVVVSSHTENRREWAACRQLAGSPLGKRGGAWWVACPARSCAGTH